MNYFVQLAQFNILFSALWSPFRSLYQHPPDLAQFCRQWSWWFQWYNLHRHGYQHNSDYTVLYKLLVAKFQYLSHCLRFNVVGKNFCRIIFSFNFYHKITTFPHHPIPLICNRRCPVLVAVYVRYAVGHLVIPVPKMQILYFPLTGCRILLSKEIGIYVLTFISVVSQRKSILSPATISISPFAKVSVSAFVSYLIWAPSTFP